MLNFLNKDFIVNVLLLVLISVVFKFFAAIVLAIEVSLFYVMIIVVLFEVLLSSIMNLKVKEYN